MRSILLLILLIPFNTANAQKKSLTLDITQSTVAAPALIYNKYYNDEAETLNFFQIGVAYHLKLQNTYYNPIPTIIDLKDYLLIQSVSGPSFRVGSFYGHKRKNLLSYYGFGINLKYLYNDSMKYTISDDYYASRSNQTYITQYDRITCLYPFLNIGIIQKYRGFMSDIYTGMQFNMKYRVRHVTSEIHKTYDNISTVIPPYTKKTFSFFPTIVFGIRLGLYN